MLHNLFIYLKGLAAAAAAAKIDKVCVWCKRINFAKACSIIARGLAVLSKQHTQAHTVLNL
jgi:hypothetical protein